MKRSLFIVIYAILITVNACAFNDNKGLSHKDSLLFTQLQIFQSQLRKEAYKLYPTKNMFTFLELNTVTGQIWMVQWGLVDNKRFKYELDTNIRISYEDELICGRFSLHPTENMFNFILLDNINGKCWQVQWSLGRDKRFVVPIF